MSLFDLDDGVTAGVDPGASGAIAFLDAGGRLLAVHDMPYLDGHVSAALLTEILDRALKEAWVERAQSMPGQGVSSSFKYGVGYGVILGVLGALHTPVQTVHPGVWKRAAGLSKDKGASRRHAIELWPDHAASFKRVKDDGRAEAALIARYGWLQLQRGAA